MISNFFKTYLIQFLIGVILSLSATLGVFYFQKNSLHADIKTKDVKIGSLESLLKACKENKKVEVLESKWANKEPKEIHYEPIISEDNNSDFSSIQFFRLH